MAPRPDHPAASAVGRTPAGSGDWYAGLDLLRIAAALLVLGFHVVTLRAWPDAPWPVRGLQAGWVGVDLFFAISGLVVGRTALAGLARAGHAFRTPFLLRRLARIVPLYLLTCAVYLLVDRPDWSVSEAALQLATHLLFVHNLWPATALAINPPTWSLGVELQFYLLLAWWLPMLRGWTPVRIAAAGLLLALGWRVAVWAAWTAGGGGDPAGLAHAVFLTPGLLDGFALGLALAVALQDGGARGTPFWRAGAAALGIALMAWGGSAQADLQSGAVWQTPAWALGLRSLVALGAGLLVWATAAQPFPAQGRRATWLRRAGDLSYGVYLWHAVVLLVLLRGTALEGPALLAITLCATLGLSALGWWLVERPANRWLRQRIARHDGAV